VRRHELCYFLIGARNPLHHFPFPYASSRSLRLRLRSSDTKSREQSEHIARHTTTKKTSLPVLRRDQSILYKVTVENIDDCGEHRLSIDCSRQGYFSAPLPLSNTTLKLMALLSTLLHIIYIWLFKYSSPN
jgi:hypothetical protein